MPTIPEELTTLPAKPEIPAADANDLVLSEFMANESKTVDACYSSFYQLVEWHNKAAADISSENNK